MIFTNKNSDELIITCKCGCGYGLHWQAGVIDEKDEEYYLSLIEMSWYAKQNSRLKSYFSRLWKALRGKDYHLTEIILKKKKLWNSQRFLTDYPKKLTRRRILAITTEWCSDSTIERSTNAVYTNG